MASPFGTLSLQDGEAGHLSLFPERVECRKVIKAAVHLPLTLSALSRSEFKAVFVEVGNAPAMSKTVDVLLGIYRYKLRDLKLSDSVSNGETHYLKQAASIASWQTELNNVLNSQIGLGTSDAACGGSTNLPRPFIVAFIDDSGDNADVHRKIKHLCDISLGYQSCCVKLSTLEKIHRQNTDNGIDRYACSLLRKMLAKLKNRIDDKDPDDTAVTPIPNATLLVGAHVAAVPTEANGTCQVYCITLSSKPIGSKGTYKITTVLKRATKPVSLYPVIQNSINQPYILILKKEALGLDVLLNAHLDEHEKPRVQLSTLSRLVFYRSEVITPSRGSTSEKTATRVDFQPEGRLPRTTIPGCRNSSPTPRGRAGSLMANLSNGQPQSPTNEGQNSRNNTEKDDITFMTATNGTTRRFAEDKPQGRDGVNGIVSRPLSNTLGLPPYAKTDPPRRHNRFWGTPHCENLFQKESERLESAISSRYPCARLFYISVSSNTKLRLYNPIGQPPVKGALGRDIVHKNVSWIASDGLTNPIDNEWFMLKASTGTTSQKPLQLNCHNMGSSANVSSLENDIKKNYEDVSPRRAFPHRVLCAHTRWN